MQRERKEHHAAVKGAYGGGEGGVDQQGPQALLYLPFGHLILRFQHA